MQNMIYKDKSAGKQEDKRWVILMRATQVGKTKCQIIL